MKKEDRLLKKLKRHLEQGEAIEKSILGAYETKLARNDTVRKGVLVATNKKVIFFSKRITGFDMEVFPYANISSIEMGKNLMGSKITLFASGNKVDVKWIKQKNLSEFISLVKSRMSRYNSESNPSKSKSADPMLQLKKLAILKDQGIVTEGEFAEKKKQLLGL